MSSQPAPGSVISPNPSHQPDSLSSTSLLELEPFQTLRRSYQHTAPTRNPDDPDDFVTLSSFNSVPHSTTGPTGPTLESHPQKYPLPSRQSSDTESFLKSEPTSYPPPPPGLPQGLTRRARAVRLFIWVLLECAWLVLATICRSSPIPLNDISSMIANRSSLEQERLLRGVWTFVANLWQAFAAFFLRDIILDSFSGEWGRLVASPSRPAWHTAKFDRVSTITSGLPAQLKHLFGDHKSNAFILTFACSILIVAMSLVAPGAITVSVFDVPVPFRLTVGTLERTQTIGNVLDPIVARSGALVRMQYFDGFNASIQYEPNYIIPIPTDGTRSSQLTYRTDMIHFNYTCQFIAPKPIFADNNRPSWSSWLRGQWQVGNGVWDFDSTTIPNPTQYLTAPISPWSLLGVWPLRRDGQTNNGNNGNNDNNNNTNNNDDDDDDDDDEDDEVTRRAEGNGNERGLLTWLIVGNSNITSLLNRIYLDTIPQDQRIVNSSNWQALRGSDDQLDSKNSSWSYRPPGGYGDAITALQCNPHFSIRPAVVRLRDGLVAIEKDHDGDDDNVENLKGDAVSSMFSSFLSTIPQFDVYGIGGENRYGEMGTAMMLKALTMQTVGPKGANVTRMLPIEEITANIGKYASTAGLAWVDGTQFSDGPAPPIVLTRATRLVEHVGLQTTSAQWIVSIVLGVFIFIVASAITLTKQITPFNARAVIGLSASGSMVQSEDWRRG